MWFWGHCANTCNCFVLVRWIKSWLHLSQRWQAHWQAFNSCHRRKRSCCGEARYASALSKPITTHLFVYCLEKLHSWVSKCQEVLENGSDLLYNYGQVATVALANQRLHNDSLQFACQQSTKGETTNNRLEVMKKIQNRKTEIYLVCLSQLATLLRGYGD